jgi:hypothetical protein
MPKQHTPQSRAKLVADAASNLDALTRDATATLARFGPTDPRTLAKWEAVETAGATVHRQSRLLAGKSRGG